MKIVYWARLNLAREEVTAALGAVGGGNIAIVESLDSLLEALPEADGLVLYDAPPDTARKVVSALAPERSRLRWMHFLTAGREGFEAVGLPGHLVVTEPAGAVAPTVAEHAMALLLALARQVPAMLSHQAHRDWSRVGVSSRARSLEGQTLAIVGFGQIGREVARRAGAFGMRSVAVTRSPKTDPLLDACHGLSELHATLGQADAVVIALALTAGTRHLFGADTLAACKPGALLVNVARGGIIDQAALKAALERGHLGGAGLDTVDPEPLPADDPLWDAPNLIISPHFAGGASLASRLRLARGAADNLERLIAGETLVHRVN